jgi:hypothetical protein
MSSGHSASTGGWQVGSGVGARDRLIDSTHGRQKGAKVMDTLRGKPWLSGCRVHWTQLSIVEYDGPIACSTS